MFEFIVESPVFMVGEGPVDESFCSLYLRVKPAIYRTVANGRGANVLIARKEFFHPMVVDLRASLNMNFGAQTYQQRSL